MPHEDGLLLFRTMAWRGKTIIRG